MGERDCNLVIGPIYVYLSIIKHCSDIGCLSCYHLYCLNTDGRYSFH